MLDAAKTLFLGCRHEKTIAKERGRGVTMKGVQTEDYHLAPSKRLANEELQRRNVRPGGSF